MIEQRGRFVAEVGVRQIAKRLLKRDILPVAAQRRLLHSAAVMRL